MISEHKNKLDRVCLGIVIVATIAFTAAIAWGIAAPVGAGHEQVVAGRTVAAFNMLRWNISFPVRTLTLEVPEASKVYAHHPFGSFWLYTLLARIFGVHLFVPRLASVLMSAATPPLLYAIGRSLWGPVEGAISALAYTVLPITLAFGHFPGFEVPLVFGCLLTTWGYLRFAEQWQTRWMIVSLVGVAWTVNSDWEGNIFLAIVQGAIFFVAFVLPQDWVRRWVRRLPPRPNARWLLLGAAIAVITAGLYLRAFHRLGAFVELFNVEDVRSKGNDAPLHDLLLKRSYWIDEMFTPLAVTLGKIALPILLVRFFLMRRLLEIFPLALFAMAVFEYVKFSNGADIHVYWPFPFAPYFALGMGVLATTAIGVGRASIAHAKGWLRDADVDAAMLVGFVVLLLAIVPSGLVALRYGRATGGRMDEHGQRIASDIDKTTALEWMSKRMESRDPVLVDNGLRLSWAMDWALKHPTRGMPMVPNRGSTTERYFVLDLRTLEAREQVRVATTYFVVTVGPFALIDLKAPHAPLEAYVFDEREPTALERYVTFATEPVRTVRADPWATWELRDRFEQTPNPPPSGTPTTLEQIRIAHNIAIASHDVAGARRWRQALLAGADTTAAVGFENGMKLLGVRRTEGVAPAVTLYFESAGSTTIDLQFVLTSTMSRRRWWSLVPLDAQVRTVGTPFLIPTRMWRLGYLYAQRETLRQRLGEERFVGGFEGNPSSEVPRTEAGQLKAYLFTLP